MRFFIGVLVTAGVMWGSAGGACAQDRLVPAGTLLQCTMNEPNFSSATVNTGDPVLCHLRVLEEFGKPVFPRGTMLGGHLEEAKEPGHFWGKGYLRITFDRVILPYGDLPVPAKVIQAKGYKVDKKGDIDGKGHAKRDVAEWMFPPLWPWKVVSLPMRGPRPRLKGEEPLQLRLMEDVSIPTTVAYGPMKPDRPPSARLAQPSSLWGRRDSIAEPEARIVSRDLLPVVGAKDKPSQLTILVLRSNEAFTLTKYRIDGDMLIYEDTNGSRGAVDLDRVDWRKTTEMTSGVRSAASAASSRAY